MSDNTSPVVYYLVQFSFYKNSHQFIYKLKCEIYNLNLFQAIIDVEFEKKFVKNAKANSEVF